MNLKHQIMICVGAFLFGFGAGFYIELKIKEGLLNEMLTSAQEVQTKLQTSVDNARDESFVLKLKLEAVNEENRHLLELNRGLSDRLQNSANNLAGRLAASRTSCLSNESARDLIRIFRSCEDFSRRAQETLTRCAADAGQCGIDRRALLLGWPQLKETDNSPKNDFLK